MPWHIDKKSDRCPASKPFAVIGGRDDDHLAGCHATWDEAVDQLRALYANDAKSMYTTPPTLG